MLRKCQKIVSDFLHSQEAYRAAIPNRRESSRFCYSLGETLATPSIAYSDYARRCRYTISLPIVIPPYSPSLKLPTVPQLRIFRVIISDNRQLPRSTAIPSWERSL